MNPFDYENIVAEHFIQQGYSAEISKKTQDYGVDIFAEKGKEKIAVQAKMFGGSTRPINRKMVMELHGAKDYFDCSKAVVATNGEIKEDAFKVANKLGIDILRITAEKNGKQIEKSQGEDKFEKIWENYVMPLEGQTVKRSNGQTNKILTVDWAGIERETSNGKKRRIKIEIFRETINHLLEKGKITREFINEEYSDRAASGIILILGNTGLFELTSRPIGLKMPNNGHNIA